MAFLLRAALVVGAVYYLSPLRLGSGEDAGPAPASAPAAGAAGAADVVVRRTLGALPEEARAQAVQQAVQAGAAEARRLLEGGLRAAIAGPGPAHPPASRDTLTAPDRQPSWRGAPGRESP
ncbi:hypothetical protein OPKNFCMD_1855 [Methylobacterium crusticola]|uniref:Uncharacterized protein n=1 Tax=Methylobacterium crusticola TaxID=1697972 RepID=A0ABQ4QUU9_9HYPH|nr:hypothetical protein [Methylobacterium crusticola]GJD49125.1 hypothetical protein OPKNFCMD_1855 [Methylobacterium crusticola]